MIWKYDPTASVWKHCESEREKNILNKKGSACDFSCCAHTAHTVCSFWAQTESNSDLPAFIWLHRVTRIWATSDTGPGGTIMWKKASHLLWAQSYPGCFSSIFETRHLLKSNKVWCLSFSSSFSSFPRSLFWLTWAVTWQPSPQVESSVLSNANN